MNLEEMKQALASDATEKNKRLEHDIGKLRKKLAHKEHEIKEKDEVLRTMFNRCYATNRLCIWCGHRAMCEKIRSVGKDG